MSATLVDLYSLDNASDEDGSQRPFARLPHRDEAWELITQGAAIDVVIVGRDLTCALCAHLLAMSGVRTLVVTSAPFGGVASAWSPTLGRVFSNQSGPPPLSRGLSSLWRTLSKRGAHMRTWFHIIRAFREFRRYAPHRCHLTPWARSEYPNILGTALLRKILSLQGIPGLPIVDDAYLTNEAMLAARQEGTFTFNRCVVAYAEISSNTGHYTIGLRDELKGRECETRVGAIVVGSGELVPSSRLASSRHTTVKADQEKIVQAGGIFVLPEVPPWGASAIAQQVSNLIVDAAEIDTLAQVHIRDLTTPGGIGYSSAISEFTREASERGVDPSIVRDAVARWGGTVRYVARYPDGLEVTEERILKGELLLSRDSDLNELAIDTARQFAIPAWGENRRDIQPVQAQKVQDNSAL